MTRTTRPQRPTPLKDPGAQRNMQPVGAIVRAYVPRRCSFAALSLRAEVGCHTSLQEASPAVKKRFMYMSGITNEDEFDKCRKTITWEGQADRSRAPYLVVAGEAEEL